MDVYKQKKGEASKFWERLQNIDRAPQWFKNAFNKSMSVFSALQAIDDFDLKIMIESYKRDLYSGKKVVLVAHSQGNFYANNAYQVIKDTLPPEYKKSIGIVAVGTPAIRVQDGGPHITNSLDSIINLVRLRFSVLPSTMRYNEPNSHKNHSFINTYLANKSPSRSKIRGYVFNTINNRLELPEKHIDCKTLDDVAVNIDTRSANGITTNSARTNGYVVSGKDIHVWTLFREGSYPSTCASTAESKPSSGVFQTGNSPYLDKTNLKPDTTYYYRKCAKGTNNRVSDGGVVSFTTNTIQTTVKTLDVTNVGTTTAEMWGEIISGDNINYWWVRGESSNISCSSSSDMDNGNTGETKSYNWSGFKAGTKYYYRFCGKGRDRTYSGAIKSFMTFAQCGSAYQASGSSEGMTVNFDVGYNSFNSTVQVIFEPYTIPDKMVITNYYSGTVKLQTPGYVSGTQKGSFKQTDARGKVKVRVYGNSNTDTQWDITVGCAGELISSSAASIQLKSSNNIDSDSNNTNTITISPPTGREGK